jgi:hypothetical protein
METLIVTVPVLQPWPLQPVNLESAPAVAFKVTTAPLSNNAEQLGPQLIPAGVLITLPLPVPFLVSDRENFVWELSELNVALQVLATSIIIFPVLHPVPLQPAKVEPATGVAVRVVSVRFANDAEQVLPQLMPEGLLVTVPLPVPFFVIDRIEFGWTGCGLKVAVQVRATFMVVTPLLQLVPLHPPNVEPTAGVAVNVTRVPLLNDAEQVPPQLMPAGLLVTVPFPVPLLVTVFTKPIVSVNCCAAGGSVVPIGVVPQTSGADGELPALLKAFTR